jgi:hypothetical protein
VQSLDAASPSELQVEKYSEPSAAETACPCARSRLMQPAPERAALYSGLRVARR